MHVVISWVLGPNVTQKTGVCMKLLKIFVLSLLVASGFMKANDVNAVSSSIEKQASFGDGPHECT